MLKVSLTIARRVRNQFQALDRPLAKIQLLNGASIPQTNLFTKFLDDPCDETNPMEMVG
ncbi:hypothetical protein PanWU01x14_170590, partial [Parasponia andersonii]